MDASPRVSPLRQRMIDDMRMRKLSEKTQTHYLRWVQRFAAYLGRSPDRYRRRFLCAAISCTWWGQRHLAGIAERGDHRVEVLLRCRVRPPEFDSPRSSSDVAIHEFVTYLHAVVPAKAGT